MKSIMEIAREVTTLDEETTRKEIFNIIKKDPKWVSEILKMYADTMVEDVLTIKHIVSDYLQKEVENESELSNQES